MFVVLGASRITGKIVAETLLRRYRQFDCRLPHDALRLCDCPSKLSRAARIVDQYAGSQSPARGPADGDTWEIAAKRLG
jgi:hypothetical protein